MTTAIWAVSGAVAAAKLLVFLPLCLSWTRRRQLPEFVRNHRQYQLFERRGAIHGLRDSCVTGIAMGTALCALSYLALPLLWWRYGILAAVTIVVIPATVAILLGSLTGWDVGGLLASVPVGGVTAAAMCAWDRRLRAIRLRGSGWRPLGTGWARGAKQAGKLFSGGLR